jgi:glycosyltransferase involved in cell wall biosynthesis
MIRRGIRQADAIIAVSKRTAEDIGNLFPEARSKIQVVYEGVHPDFRPVPDPGAVPESLLRWFDSPFVLFTGTLSPRKNVPVLIEAFARFLKIPGCESHNLLLAGKRGWYDEEILRRPAELGIGNRVLHVDYPSRRILAELYRRASLFCCLSLYEGFGLPVLEAMASGTPVLVSDRGALPEIVADEFSVVEINDAGPIAEKMARIALDPPLQGRLIRDGLTRSRYFSWQKAAETTWKIYRDVFSH